VYQSRKGAQDAHEAIRPTALGRTPERMAPYLSPEELKLYELIWKRFVASQMKSGHPGSDGRRSLRRALYPEGHGIGASLPGIHAALHRGFG